MLPPRPFVLPGPMGWICNLLGIAYVIVTTVLFLFPPTLPVTGSNMSTLSVALSSLRFVLCLPGGSRVLLIPHYTFPRSSHSNTPLLIFFPSVQISIHPRLSNSSAPLSLTFPNSDYCIVAFFIVIVISVIQWFVDGRKNYKGPVVELIGEDEVVYAGDNVDDKARGADGAENGEASELQGDGAME